jgi:hypothetical protein
LGEVLSSINKAVIPAVQLEVATLGKRLEGTGEAVQEGVKGGMDIIKGLFGK